MDGPVFALSPVCGRTPGPVVESFPELVELTMPRSSNRRVAARKIAASSNRGAASFRSDDAFSLRALRVHRFFACGWLSANDSASVWRATRCGWELMEKGWRGRRDVKFGKGKRRRCWLRNRLRHQLQRTAVLDDHDSRQQLCRCGSTWKE